MIRDREAARDLVSIAVHDLREPLRAIRASSELLAGAAGDARDETTNRCLRYIADGVDRMETLIRDIAEYCYAQVRELDLKEAGMETALLEAERQLSEEIKRSDAVLTHDPLPAVTGDFFALALVFRCLIDNSCKFSGKNNLIVHVSAKKQAGEWLFSVRDNGQGFDPVYRERIFNPFERLNGKQYPGSGLGLPLARSILELHGGRIWAESEPGQGSTFWFSLPVPEASASTH